MASKRMFSKHIVHSSRLLRLPPTCRLLYYDLGMCADDDGYCEWFPVLQMTGAKQSDLEMLAAMKMVAVFDDEVLMIRDWKENNLIRSDRYVPSRYISKYGLTEPMQLGIPLGNQMDTQVRLGKDSIKHDAVPASTEEFKWEEYVARMDENPRKHVQMIAFFFRERGISFGSEAEVKEAIKRHARDAVAVVKFPEDRIMAAFDKAKSKYRDVDWTLGTIKKILTN